MKHIKGDDLQVGDRVKKLVVIELIPDDTGKSMGLVKCKCDCGNIYTDKYSTVKWHQIGSCGCTPKGEKHGYARNPLYSVWREMNRRCFNENCCNYHKYGALGISVCEEWRRDCDGGNNGFMNFCNWALNNNYKKGLTLDRKNQFQDYSPDNCRWVSYTIQNTHLTISVNNQSGYMGVQWSKRDQIWIARIRVNGEQLVIGYYHNKKDAVDARNNYIQKHNLPHTIQPWIGFEGYNKNNFEATIQND
jgi:hypothetical protein